MGGGYGCMICFYLYLFFILIGCESYVYVFFCFYCMGVKRLLLFCFIGINFEGKGCCFIVCIVQLVVVFWLIGKKEGFGWYVGGYWFVQLYGFGCGIGAELVGCIKIGELKVGIGLFGAFNVIFYFLFVEKFFFG